MYIDLTVTAQRTSDFLQRRRIEVAILLCMNVIYFFAYFHRVAVPGTIFNELQAAFNANAMQVTLLGAIYLYIYGGMQLIVGVLNDRFGPMRIMLAGGVLISVGGLLFPLSPSLPWLYAARVLVGLGSSLAFISVVKALDILFTPRLFPGLLGISMAIGCSGGLVGTLPFERMAHAWGWKPSMLGMSMLSVLALAAVAALFRRTDHVEHHARQSSSLNLGAVLWNRYSIPMLITGPLNFAVYFLMQASIGKKFLEDYAGLSPMLASSMTGVMMLVTMVVGLVGGFLPRLFGDRRKPLIIFSIVFTFSGMALFLLFILLGMRGGWFLICYVLMALSLYNSPVGNAMMKELNPPNAVGTAIGLLNGACYLAVAVLSTITGAIMDHFKDGAVHVAGHLVYPPQAYLTICTLCLVLSGIAFVSAFFLRETRGESIYAAEAG